MKKIKKYASYFPAVGPENEGWCEHGCDLLQDLKKFSNSLLKTIPSFKEVNYKLFDKKS
jgi:hypothetical protein